MTTLRQRERTTHWCGKPLWFAATPANTALGIKATTKYSLIHGELTSCIELRDVPALVVNEVFP